MLGTLVTAASLWLPSVALACPVCFSIKNEENQLAYIVSTGFMTALPLLVMGGAAWWLRRRTIELSRPVLKTADGTPLRIVPTSKS